MNVIRERLSCNGMNFNINIHRKKIKTVRLRIEADATVYISVPQYFTDQKIKDLINTNRDWIGQKCCQMRELDKYSFTLNENELFFRGETWVNSLQSGISSHTVLDFAEKRVVSAAPIKGEALTKWYTVQARFYIPARLRELAEKHGFHYSKVSVKALKRKWGSWRTDGVLTVNAKLILVPDDVCEAILLHELVHTVHPDHSKAFWAKLYEVCPYWDKASAWLKNYHNFIEKQWFGC